MQFLNIFLRTTHYLENFLIFQLKIFATFFLSIKKKDAICNFVASGEKWKCFLCRPKLSTGISEA